MKLNFGCGDKKREGFINIDISSKCKPDYVWDIRKAPYPEEWAPKGKVTRIECDNLMEHLTPDEVIFVMNEFHRILKDGGTILVVSPALHRLDMNVLDAVFGDPTHRSFFTTRTFDYWSLSDPMRRWHNFGKDYGIEPFRQVTKSFNNLHGTWTFTK